MTDHGVARIEIPVGAWTVEAEPDPVSCDPCAATRWLRILNLAVTRPSSRDIAQALKKMKPSTSGSSQQSRSTRYLDDATLAVPLRPPIDQWGYVPFPVQRLTPHALSRRVRDIFAGDLGAHRDLSVEMNAQPAPPAPSPVPRAAAYRQQDWQASW
jgi:hypothetical protein